MAQQGSSRGLLLALVLLIGLGVAGAWNYRRNAATEEEEYRPYRAYDLAQLEQLIEAYQAEVGQWQGSYDSLKRVEVRDHQHFDERVREFERVQGAGRRWRDLSGGLAERQAMLRELEKERSRRQGDSAPFGRFLRRLLTI